MGLMDKLRGRFRNRAESSDDGSIDAEWNMGDVPFAGSARNTEQNQQNLERTIGVEPSRPKPERTGNERQQRKIVAAFLKGHDGYADTSHISDRDAAVSEDDRELFLSMMMHGQVTEKGKYDFIDHIGGPLIGHTPHELSEKLTDKHEKRILAKMSGRGFDNWQYTAGNDIQSFLDKYPNPADFEKDSEEFLTMIAANNNAQKAEEYRDSMESFKRAMYGKKYEYYKELQMLSKEAAERRREQRMASMGHNARTVAQMLAGANYSNRLSREEIAANKAMSQEAEYMGFERERSSEWQPGEAASFRVSRGQTRADIVTRENIDRGLSADNSCEDSLYMDTRNQLYGVFDGAGGMRGGQAASRRVGSSIGELSYGVNIRGGSDLAGILNQANERVVRDPDAGVTTAVLTKVVERNGQKYLAYASAGDSRLYIVGGDGRARQITRDEGEGRFISNCLGSKDGTMNPVKQFGDVPLRPGDRIVLCSDGITGDYGSDLMTDAEMASIVNSSRTPDDAAKNLVAKARKKDDRTAVVFSV